MIQITSARRTEQNAARDQIGGSQSERSISAHLLEAANEGLVRGCEGHAVGDGRPDSHGVAGPLLDRDLGGHPGEDAAAYKGDVPCAVLVERHEPPGALAVEQAVVAGGVEAAPHRLKRRLQGGAREAHS